MFKSTWCSWLVATLFFFLPWQTVYVFGTVPIANGETSFGILSVYVAECLILALGLLFFITRRSNAVPPAIAGLCAIFFFAFVSALLSIQPAVSWMHIFHLFTAGVLFLLLLDRRVDLKFAMVGFVAGLIFPVLFGIWQTVIGGSPAFTWLGLSLRDAHVAGEAVIQTSVGTRILRAYGSFPHPNIFGGYLAVGCVAVFGLWAHAKTSVHRMLLASAGLLFLLGLLLTFSRSAWIGLMLAGLVGGFVLRIKSMAVAKKLVLVVAGVVIGGTLLFSMIGGFAFRPGSDAAFESRSLRERVEQYKEFSAVIGTRWLFGYGIGTYPWAVEAAFPGRAWWEYQPIHNVPLLIVGEIGVIGFIAVLFWLGSMDKVNVARFPHRDAVTAFMMGNVLLTIIFFDHYVWSLWPGLALVAFVMALTVRLGER